MLAVRREKRKARESWGVLKELAPKIAEEKCSNKVALESEKVPKKD